MSTVADIFRLGLPDYRQLHGPLNSDALKAATAIVNCRTQTLGGRVEQCDRCGHELILFNSCRNRHCPACQTTARLQWVSDRVDDLLPVGYFHAVFTTPHELAPFALRNRTAFYNLMFRAVKETLLQLGADPKRLGAHLGFILVLHTWGQTLLDHPHIHCIIPGGGLDLRAQRWKPSRARFLFPIPVVQKLYRGKLMDFFVQAVKAGEIQFHGNLQPLAEPPRFQALVDAMYAKKWVVYIKPPFASPQAVVKYLGQYTHRVAISNRRILALENGMVTFSYRDYAAGYAEKTMTVTVAEFIRRFLMHIVPSGFVKIRHCGFLANRSRKGKLAQCRAIFRKKPPTSRKEKRAMHKPWSEIVKELTGFDPTRCPLCHLGTLVVVTVLPRLIGTGLPILNGG